MFERFLLLILTEHRGKTIGILLGLIAAILFINYGFWRTLFIILCIALGYCIGKILDDNKNVEDWVKELFKQKY